MIELFLGGFVFLLDLFNFLSLFRDDNEIPRFISRHEFRILKYIARYELIDIEGSESQRRLGYLNPKTNPKMSIRDQKHTHRFFKAIDLLKRRRLIVNIEKERYTFDPENTSRVIAILQKRNKTK